MNFKVHQVDRDTHKDGRVNGKEAKNKHGGHAAAAPPPFSNYGYPPSSYQGEMPDPSFGAQYFDLPQPEQGMRIMCAYARRNMEETRNEHFSSIMIKDTIQEPIKEIDRRHDHE